MSRWPTGNFHVDPSAPEAYGICDRCSFMYALAELQAQPVWRGRTLAELNILVCGRCLDVPNEQDRVISIPPDPIPVRNPRPIRPYQARAAENWDENGNYDDDVSTFGE